MDRHSREQYLARVREEYENADKEGRGRLLDEAAKRMVLNWKVLIRKLARWQPAVVWKKKRSRKRKAIYGATVVSALAVVREIFDYPCGQRLAPALKRELGRPRELGEVRCSPEVAEKLEQISVKTIDRLLGREKQVRHLRRDRNPAVYPLPHQRIPVKVAEDWDTEEVGNVQVDFLAHCGHSTAGEYLHTISAADIARSWWEGEAMAGRSQRATRAGLDRIRGRLPCAIKELRPDNDSGVINDLLRGYCQAAKTRMSRCRPCQKNRNGWVEQRNWTHVRRLVGYRPYNTTTELALLKALYGELSLYKNFFQPALELKRKTRVGGKIHGMYDRAGAPYERLLASGQLDRKTRARLREIYESLNPAELHRYIEALRAQLFQVAESKTASSPVSSKRRAPVVWSPSFLSQKASQMQWIRA
jgi:hypothetical protein